MRRGWNYVPAASALKHSTVCWRRLARRSGVAAMYFCRRRWPVYEDVHKISVRNAAVYYKESLNVQLSVADPSGRAIWGWMDLRPLGCSDCGFESRGGHGYLSLVSVVCCQLEVSASGWSLVQRSPTECGVSECDCEASTMRRPWPTRGCRAVGRRKFSVCLTLWRRSVSNFI
jgi:hypothetical protein